MKLAPGWNLDYLLNLAWIFSDIIWPKDYHAKAYSHGRLRNFMATCHSEGKKIEMTQSIDETP